MRNRALAGRLPKHALPAVEHLFERSVQWNVKVAAEISVAIGFALFGQALRWSGNTGFNSVEAQSLLPRFTVVPDDSTLDDAFDGAVSAWAGLVDAVVDKGWAGQFRSLESLCPTVPEREPQHASDRVPASLGWLFTPRRDVLATYAGHQDLTLDEFLDLIQLVPPRGYSVDRRISNTSAFKVVYSAAETEGSKKVALKRYRDWTSGSNRVLKQLNMPLEKMVENDTMTDWHGTLRHTHILPCQTARNKYGEIFIIEPLLTDLIEPGQLLGPRKLREIFLAICEAVMFMHTKHIVHSDIKHDNVGIHDGDAVLLDLGIALRLDGVQATRSNPGSLKTRAPELFSESAAPTRSSDVFALGATLMALANGGDHPFITRAELETLPPAHDVARGAIESRIRERVDRFRRRPAQFEKTILSRIPKRHAWAVEAIGAACRFDPARRPTTAKLVHYLTALDGMTAVTPP